MVMTIILSAFIVCCVLSNGIIVSNTSLPSYTTINAFNNEYLLISYISPSSDGAEFGTLKADIFDKSFDALVKQIEIVSSTLTIGARNASQCECTSISNHNNDIMFVWIAENTTNSSPTYSLQARILFINNQTNDITLSDILYPASNGDITNANTLNPICGCQGNGNWSVSWSYNDGKNHTHKIIKLLSPTGKKFNDPSLEWNISSTINGNNFLLVQPLLKFEYENYCYLNYKSNYSEYNLYMQQLDYVSFYQNNFHAWYPEIAMNPFNPLAMNYGMDAIPLSAVCGWFILYTNGITGELYGNFIFLQGPYNVVNNQSMNIKNQFEPKWFGRIRMKEITAMTNKKELNSYIYLIYIDEKLLNIYGCIYRLSFSDPTNYPNGNWTIAQTDDPKLLYTETSDNTYIEQIELDIIDEIVYISWAYTGASSSGVKAMSVDLQS